MALDSGKQMYEYKNFDKESRNLIAAAIANGAMHAAEDGLTAEKATYDGIMEIFGSEKMARQVSSIALKRMNSFKSKKELRTTIMRDIIHAENSYGHLEANSAPDGDSAPIGRIGSFNQEFFTYIQKSVGIDDSMSAASFGSFEDNEWEQIESKPDPAKIHPERKRNIPTSQRSGPVPVPQQTKKVSFGPSHPEEERPVADLNQYAHLIPKPGNPAPQQPQFATVNRLSNSQLSNSQLSNCQSSGRQAGSTSPYENAFVGSFRSGISPIGVQRSQISTTGLPEIGLPSRPNNQTMGIQSHSASRSAHSYLPPTYTGQFTTGQFIPGRLPAGQNMVGQFMTSQLPTSQSITRQHSASQPGMGQNITGQTISPPQLRQANPTAPSEMAPGKVATDPPQTTCQQIMPVDGRLRMAPFTPRNNHLSSTPRASSVDSGMRRHGYAQYPIYYKLPNQVPGKTMQFYSYLPH